MSLITVMVLDKSNVLPSNRK